MSQLNNDLYAIIRCGIQFRGEKTAPLGLKSCHISYLSRICCYPGISQDRLAQMMFINKSNVARQAAALEKGGFITRTPSPSDKRVLQLHPTDKALELMPQLEQIVTQWDEQIMAGLTQEEVQTVSAVLQKMKDNAARWVTEK
ncbi:MAG: MarR family transcriptional regulator [Oscillospiraceae bacterium]|nr:MarR family transcriptional regulator [Oscillospiraceae bacterium]MBQ9930383.1 MarR family transcriptional regulator [Oscillospiraceae bacterium]